MENLDYSDSAVLFEAATKFALRFDGYKYRRENKKFDDFNNYQILVSGGEIPDDELLPTLFCIQRSLSRAQVTMEDEEYLVFFDLALKCLDKDEEIPQEYRNEDYYAEWEKIIGDSDKIKKAIKNIKN